MRRNIVFAGIVIFALALLGVYVFLWSPAPQPPMKLERVVVRLGWLHQAQFAGMYVAQEKGLYRDAGLDVELRAYEEKFDQAQELEQGGASFSIMKPLELVAAVARGIDIRAVAALYAISPFAFASRKEANIKTPIDFRDKILGLSMGALQGEVIYGALLRRATVATTAVRFVALGFDAADALIEKRADVIPLYRTNEVYRLAEQSIAYNLLLPEYFGFRTYGDAIVTTNALIDKRPDIVRKFVSATLEGWEYAFAYPDEALAATARYEHASYNDPAYERFILMKSLPLMKPSPAYRIGDMHFATWNRTYDAMRASDIVTGYVDVEQLYTTAFLKP